MKKRWGEKRYHSVDYDLKNTFGEKVYKIGLNADMTCPNRDGTVGHGGCIFCSSHGSGDFAGDAQKSIRDQLILGKEQIRSKRPVNSFIAYFQAFTNTYAPIDYLRKVYMEAAADPDVKLISIATRPDCLGPEVLSLLKEIHAIKPVWVELGLQTIHPKTAVYIRRGYELPVFEKALHDLKSLGIPVIVHVILYLPHETVSDMLETIHYLNRMQIDGIKLQLLHVLSDTDLYADHQKEPFYLPDMDEYIELLSTIISQLSPDITIHRLTGDGARDLLIAPLWSQNKRTILNKLQNYLKCQDIWQGKEYHG